MSTQKYCPFSRIWLLKFILFAKVLMARRLLFRSSIMYFKLFLDFIVHLCILDSYSLIPRRIVTIWLHSNIIDDTLTVKILTLAAYPFLAQLGPQRPNDMSFLLSQPPRILLIMYTFGPGSCIWSLPQNFVCSSFRFYFRIAKTLGICSYLILTLNLGSRSRCDNHLIINNIYKQLM